MLGDNTSFFSSISLFFVSFFVILRYYLFLQKLFYYYYIIIIFYENYFYFFMFRDVPGCSGMFRHVPECSVFRVLSTPLEKLVLNHPPHSCFKIATWFIHHSMEKKRSNLYKVVTLGNSLGPVPERPISVNARLRFWTAFVFYIPMHCLHTFCLRTFCVSVSLLFLVVKAQQYFVTSSCMLLDEKTVLEIWLNPGLNLPIFWGTGPRWSLNRICLLSRGVFNV